MTTVESESSSPASTGDNGRPIRILYVDDDPSLARIAEMELDHLGYDVTALTSSREALNLFQDGNADFDLVISDINMPEMPGDEMVRKIHRLQPNVPIMLITGYDHRVAASEAQRLNIIAFFTKPYCIDEVHGRIQQILGR